MAKITYEISISRKSAALYLAWEYGINRANVMLKSAKPDPTYPESFLRLPVFWCSRPTLRSANDMAQRIRDAIAYQEGRLGRPYTGGSVYVERA